MIIKRRGSAANHGTSNVDLKGASVSWSNNNDCVVLSKNTVGDFSSSSYHDYEVYITNDDFQEIIEALSKDGVTKDFGKVELFLKNSHRCLNRLLSIASGIFPKKPDEKVDKKVKLDFSKLKK